jgi:hypothetical protein
VNFRFGPDSGFIFSLHEHVQKFTMVGVGFLDTTGLAVGLKKGFLVEKRKLAARPASRKGVRAVKTLSQTQSRSVIQYLQFPHIPDGTH